jgi:hypothetical protein
MQIDLERNNTLKLTRLPRQPYRFFFLKLRSHKEDLYIAGSGTGARITGKNGSVQIMKTYIYPKIGAGNSVYG